MAQTYTLDEAATRLGMPPEEFKRRLKEDLKTVRSFRDGATLRFRASDIEELARSLGHASDPGMPLSNEPADPPTLASDEFILPDLSPPSAPARASAKPAADDPLAFASDDVFTLPGDEADVGKPAPRPKGRPDSDVRIEAGPSSIPRGREDHSVVPTEEIAIDFSGPGSAILRSGSSSRINSPKSSTRLSAPETGKSGKNLGGGSVPPPSEEFELRLDADSDSFEVKLPDDDSDEVSLGDLPPKPEGRGGESGINLRAPADSGISLEKKGRRPAPPADDDSLDFDLSPDSSFGPTSKGKLSGPKTSTRLNARDQDQFELSADKSTGQDSEFELALDDSLDVQSSLEQAALNESESGKNDIFETDFEIPAVDDSGSEAVALDDSGISDSSDFDLALEESDAAAEDESGSQVMLVEDDPDSVVTADDGDVDLADVELEEDEEDASVAAALQGVKGRAKDDEDFDEDEDEDGEPAAASVGRPAPWGVLPALVLLPAFFVVTVGGLMSYELLHTMWGYHQPQKPAAPLIRGIADMFDMPIKDQ